jgi:hypothetical protein
MRLRIGQIWRALEKGILLCPVWKIKPKATDKNRNSRAANAG